MTDALSQLAAFARAVEPTLDHKSYYELLNVGNNATIAQIRDAYYKVAAQLHPDRYIAMPDRDARDKLETIYSRITEGYRVLSDPQKRKTYDDELKQGRRRLITTTREKKGPANPEDGITHPEAKKFFRLGMNAMTARNWKSAALNFNLARAYEPTNKLILEKMDEAKAQQTASAIPPPPTKT